MNKYIIISLAFGKEVWSDLHDIEMDLFAKQSKIAIARAKEQGVDLFFTESSNDRIISSSFALVEYNFDLTNEEKQSLVEFLTQFFHDGKFCKRYVEMENTLKAVRFLRTNGELIVI